jgi:hypothetical protein
MSGWHDFCAIEPAGPAYYGRTDHPRGETNVCHEPGPGLIRSAVELKRP